jgi:cation diffusion facilitator CzcD-associated flavoprotein CzcO
MNSTRKDDRETHASEQLDTHFDAVIVGAGFSGLYMLHKLRNEIGFSVQLFEAGDGVGGTWYWNRYPGVRCDSDSYLYCYSFSKELLQEWEWSERYPEQPEILRYLNHVADRFDLRRSIQFGTRVSEATFDEKSNTWAIRTEKGDRVTAHTFICATGALSSANQPDFKGLSTFRGQHYHTGRWPHEGVDLAGKRVGIIGTGASAVQAIPVIAKQARHLTVFQRTPNFCVPARNGKVDPALVKSRKANYDVIWNKVRNSFAGLELEFIDKSVLEATPEEREREFRARWDAGGFGFWIGNYADMLGNREANEICAEFLRDRIRETVKDPQVAKKLIPTTYPYGTKRQPLDTDYFETFNRDNVSLVDVNETPIQEITPSGIRTSDKEYGLDVIIFATGFDAMTGPLNKIRIAGIGGKLLQDKWSDGPRSYLGVATVGFPNMFTITGPGSPSVISNMPVSIEQHVEWIASCLAHMRKNKLVRISPKPEAEDEWMAHVAEVANSTLFPEANSWYMGANIPGKPRVFMPYLGGVGPYRQKCDEVAFKGYEGFALSA